MAIGTEYTCKECGKIFIGRAYSAHLRFHRTKFEEIRQDGTRRAHLIYERGHKCEVCGIAEWMNKPAPIELDHIDGNCANNVRENLRLICPNCHAQTEFYKGANAGRFKDTKRQNTMKKYPNYRYKKIMGSELER